MRIGPYEIFPDPIATGGQGIVYRSLEPGTNEPVAVKVATPSQNNFVHDGKLRRLKREFEALRRLDHPNAPSVLRADPGGEWYSMPLALHDLDHKLELGAMSWQELRAGMLGVSDVVAKAHGLDLVHRDLHPGNILIYRDRWSVADWGFVFNPRVERQTRQLAAFGREFYIAPEILRDPGTVRPSADIFALGRLADRGARLGLDRRSDGPAASWWRSFIEGAGAYEVRDRWQMVDVLAHLRTPLPESRPSPVSVTFREEFDICPNCGSPQGFDAACRCMRCHAVAY